MIRLQQYLLFHASTLFVVDYKIVSVIRLCATRIITIHATLIINVELLISLKIIHNGRLLYF